MWNRFREHYFADPATGLSVDISRINFPDRFFGDMEPAMQAAFAEMAALEARAIAHPDERRMLGHYWLRAAGRAPAPELVAEIERTVARIKQFTAKIHDSNFRHVLVIGIGGSALGPQFVSAALTTPRDRMRPSFFDN